MASMATARKACHFFLRNGCCKFGAKCKFLHGQDDDRPPPAPDPLREWRHNIPQPGTIDTPINLARFFQQAWTLVRSDYGVMQNVILALAQDGGLGRIKELLEQDHKFTVMVGPRFIQQELLPFFSTILHPDVASSTLLEIHMVTIYNVIFGPHGNRAAALFEFLARHYATLDWSQDDAKTDFSTIFNAFVEVMLMNGSAHLHQQLVTTAELLVDKVIDGTRDSHDGDLYKIRRLADRLNRHLNMGKDIPFSTQIRPETSEKKATFVPAQNPPGGRHNNDHADVRHIKIMPTFDEINSTHPEYLPVKGQQEMYLSSFEALIDRHFRLLREDTIGQLRDAVRMSLQIPSQGKKNPRDGPRLHVYERLKIVDVFFLRKSGIELFVRVDQPVKNEGRRKEWWNRSKRLQVEALVCITNIGQSHIFCTVSSHGPPDFNAGKHRDRTPPEIPAQQSRIQQYQYHSLYSREGAYMSLKPVSTRREDLAALLATTGNVSDCKLVEFPGVLLQAFQPTLAAMQSMLLTQDMPFTEVLTAEQGTVIDLSAPAYTQSPDFAFNLACLTETKADLIFDPRRPLPVAELLQRSTLDGAQVDALEHCLKSSLALVQGPPGTGKSFTGIALIKVLLTVRKKADLGPIVCVCYTNHALDQLLEHLHESGVEQIIRVGSRSKSEVLEQVNIRKVAQEAGLTPAEKYARFELYRDIDSDVKEGSQLLDTMHKAHYLRNIKDYLRRHNQNHYCELLSDDDEAQGWTLVTGGNKSDPLQAWIKAGLPAQKGSVPRPIQILETATLSSMTRLERETLSQTWIEIIKRKAVDRVLQVSQSFYSTDKRLGNVRGNLDLRCMQQANVVGLTTSGLARNLRVLRKLRAKVLVCEEAGEVLEAHILTALLPSLEHAILIGDHQQLRPQVQNYELTRENPRGAKYSLDVSLFERLVDDPSELQPSIQFKTLAIQRRMHPSISRLIRNTLYPDLKDAPNVQSYPEVVGLARRLFWFDHRVAEDAGEQEGGTSHSNPFEVTMVTALVSHLVRQGVYRPGEIAVLTPYLGQLSKLRTALGKITQVAVGERDLADASRQGFNLESDTTALPNNLEPEKVTLLQALRVATVDNFQGEEAKIVVISLVRSNAENRCGFLRTANRINVLLSRAQHGMYIFGNSETAASVQMWQDVVNMLRESGDIGFDLGLQCPRHPGTLIEVSSPEDFITSAPEGGCDLLCDRRLLCGHPCRQKCHSTMLHNVVHCLEACPRSLKACDHSCPRPCGDPCIEDCEVVLRREEVRLPCGHTITDPMCWQKRTPEVVKCTTMVAKEVPQCGHSVMVPCHVDVTEKSYTCEAVCGAEISCGHQCRRSCFRCLPQHELAIQAVADHGKCQQPCGRNFNSCNHSCSQPCHGQQGCSPCSTRCELACVHSKCDRKCNEPCAPCADEQCSSQCPHSKCTMPCAAPCDWLPCSQRCSKLLNCGHQCPSLCGELCPGSSHCQTCATVKVKQLCVDVIEMKEYAEIDLDDEPCIFPPCGHALTVTSMDGLMNMSVYYELAADGSISGLKHEDVDMTKQAPVCPTCRGSLRSINRYGRIVKQGLLVETTKRFINWSNAQYLPLAIAVRKFSEDLSKSTGGQAKQFVDRGLFSTPLTGTKAYQVQEIVDWTPTYRYENLRKVFERISNYASSVAMEEQPFRRVYDLVQHKRRTQGTSDGTFHIGEGVLQTSQHIRALVLLTRTHLTILCDFLCHATLDLDQSHIDLATNRQEVQSLAATAQAESQHAVEAECSIFYARYCAAEQLFLKSRIEKLSRSGGSAIETDTIRAQLDVLQADGLAKLKHARAIVASHQGTAQRLVTELDEVEKMIKNSNLHDVILPEEMKAIYEAMQGEFGRSTGHWYRCRNNHLFTIGECGMAMQQRACPQCGAPVGGQHHQPAEGVTHADDLERQMRNTNLG